MHLNFLWREPGIHCTISSQESPFAGVVSANCRKCSKVQRLHQVQLSGACQCYRAAPNTVLANVHSCCRNMEFDLLHECTAGCTTLLPCAPISGTVVVTMCSVRAYDSKCLPPHNQRPFTEHATNSPVSTVALVTHTLGPVMAGVSANLLQTMTPNQS